MTSDQDYHSHPAISASQLKSIATGTLRHYWADYVDPDRPERAETDAMRFGTQLHMLTLEPARFAETYHLDLTPPDAPRRPTAKQLETISKALPREGTKAREEWDRIAAAAAWWADWDASHPIPEGSEALSADRWRDLQGMSDSLLRCPIIGGLLTQPGVAEEAIHWHDPDLGVDCRCRPDWLTSDGWILDLKSTVSANPRRFRWQAWDLGYDIQAWWYLRGLERGLGIKPQGFVFGAVEKRRPWVSTPILATEALLQRGRGRAELAVAQLLEAQRTGVWPGYLPAGQLADLDPPVDRDARPSADVDVELY
jgi:exodeoxyribonuclease VIII